MWAQLKVHSRHVVITAITWFQLIKSINVLVITSCKMGIVWELLLVTRDCCPTWPLQINVGIDRGALKMHNSQSKEVNSVTCCNLETTVIKPWMQHFSQDFTRDLSTTWITDSLAVMFTWEYTKRSPTKTPNFYLSHSNPVNPTYLFAHLVSYHFHWRGVFFPLPVTVNIYDRLPVKKQRLWLFCIHLLVSS